MSFLLRLMMSACAFCLVIPLAAQSAPVDDAFAKMKTLEGRWKMTTPEGPAFVEYKVGSGGSAIYEYMFDMVSVYHQDGKTLMMTHYCGAGNQPRMRATQFADPATPVTDIVFDFVDVTNAKPDDFYIYGVKFHWIDANHVHQTWSDHAKDGTITTFTFELEREQVAP